MKVAVLIFHEKVVGNLRENYGIAVWATLALAKVAMRTRVLEYHNRYPTARMRAESDTYIHLETLGRECIYRIHEADVDGFIG